ncbi:MAG: HpaII family restriction endonuclease [Polaribacter sp.]
MNNIFKHTIFKPNNEKNKGEWTGLLVFVKLLIDQKLHLSDKKLNPKDAFFNIKKVTTQNLDLEFFIIDKSTIQLKDKNSEKTKEIKISEILNTPILKKLTNSVSNGKRTFTIPAFEIIQKTLEFDTIKGGTSYQKADIQLDISNKDIKLQNEGFGIKSYLGSKPTLLNASGNTNFIFEIEGINYAQMDEINAIDTKTKLTDRIHFIEAVGGSLNSIGAEKETMEYNLKMADSLMPNIIGELLLSFYSKRISKITDIVNEIDTNGKLNSKINYGDKKSLEVKIKKLLIDILLGFFAGTKWNGEYISNGTIVMKKTGGIVGFHIIDLKSLKDYLFENIKLDTPSTTRHRFGKIYKEKNGKLYFKLNLQLRF